MRRSFRAATSWRTNLRWPVTLKVTRQFHAINPRGLRREEGTEDDDIPFVHELESRLQKWTTDSEQPQSTISHRERQAFARLFDDVLNKPDNPKNKPKKPARMAIEDTEAMERFPSALRGMAATAAERMRYHQSVMRVTRELEATKREAADAAEDPVRKLQEEQHERIEGLLQNAETDAELWKVLNEEVFDVIKKLDLDGPLRSRGQSKPRSKSTLEKDTELAVMAPNYPSFLITAIRQLRFAFPSSPLPFAMLPATKRLGRASYMLGASTVLYNEIIAATWITHADFARIDELLHEMDNSGLDFDSDTLQLLESIRAEGNRAKNGKLGPVRQEVWRTESTGDKWSKVLGWIDVIKQRLEDEAVRKANQHEYALD